MTKQEEKLSLLKRGCPKMKRGPEIQREEAALLTSKRIVTVKERALVVLAKEAVRCSCKRQLFISLRGACLRPQELMIFTLKR